MDPSRFDHLTRLFGGAGTRRRLVALLATLPLGGALTTLGGDEAAAEPPHQATQPQAAQPAPAQPE